MQGPVGWQDSRSSPDHWNPTFDDSLLSFLPHTHSFKFYHSKKRLHLISTEAEIEFGQEIAQLQRYPQLVVQNSKVAAIVFSPSLLHYQNRLEEEHVLLSIPFLPYSTCACKNMSSTSLVVAGFCFYDMPATAGTSHFSQLASYTYINPLIVDCFSTSVVIGGKICHYQLYWTTFCLAF